MRSTQHAARRIERITYAAARGLAPAQNSTRRAREAGAGFAARAGHRQEDVMRSSKTSQSRLNTTEANQPVAIAIIVVARP